MLRSLLLAATLLSMGLLWKRRLGINDRGYIAVDEHYERRPTCLCCRRRHWFPRAGFHIHGTGRVAACHALA